jgi:hypothetical protein
MPPPPPPQGSFAAAVGADDFMDKLDRYGQPGARQQWARLMARVQPLGTAIFGLPSAAVRTDAWAAVTLGVRYAPALARVLLAGGSKLEAPFSRILEEEQVTDPFILHWLDLICFLLQVRHSHSFSCLLLLTPMHPALAAFCCRRAIAIPSLFRLASPPPLPPYASLTGSISSASCCRCAITSVVYFLVSLLGDCSSPLPFTSLHLNLYHHTPPLSFTCCRVPP